VALHSQSELHSYRGRRGGAMRLGAESWCLLTRQLLTVAEPRLVLVGDQQSEPTFAVATDAVSNPIKGTSQPGGGSATGSRHRSPSRPGPARDEGVRVLLPPPSGKPRAPQLNNDSVVVQRRRAGQRRHNRHAPPSPHASNQPQHAAGTLAPTLFTRVSEFLNLQTGFVRLDPLGPVRVLSFCLGSCVATQVRGPRGRARTPPAWRVTAAQEQPGSAVAGRERATSQVRRNPWGGLTGDPAWRPVRTGV
jgi:hypothetical protein